MSIIRKYIRWIASSLLLNILLYILAPMSAWALTSGPTAPEYTSFEPLDTSDMVNLATGDLVYNLPLLEVPGPAGGYPLSLSYHAGIQPNEEASWVGMGWTLNPGSITRTVNGFPDDQFGTTETRRDYWKGGETSSFSAGVGVAGINFGLSYSQDTYQGVGIGFNLSKSVNLLENVKSGFFSLDAGIGFGADGYGNTSVGPSLGIGYSKEIANNINASFGLSTNFNSISGSAGLSRSFKDRRGNLTLANASLSTNNLKPQFSTAVSFNQMNGKAGHVSTRSRGLGVSIPFPGFSLSLGFRNTRYFIDETTALKTIGSLYSEEIPGKNFDDYSYDSYSLEEFFGESPERSEGGSFPAYDQYQVTAQGLGGNIRPHHFQPGYLMRQNVIDDDDNYIIQFKTNSQQALSKPHFRFANDFSNAFSYPENLQLDKGSGQLDNQAPIVEEEGWNEDSKKLAGSQPVVYYTVQQIENGTAEQNGLVEVGNVIPIMHAIVHTYGDRGDPDGPISDIEKREFDLTQQIGAYKITNQSGVTYHYGLPVYAYDEHQFNEKKSRSQGHTFIEYDQKAPYAYTWLLTGITGPDFVDRNGNAKLDEGDWGYWVKFDYGQWSNKYHWRTPYSGMLTDIDPERQTRSRGVKSLWYLNSIETSSHIALFEKEIRADAKGLVLGMEGLNARASFSFGDWQVENVVPTSTLRLKNVYLINKSDYISNKSASDYFQMISTFQNENEDNGDDGGGDDGEDTPPDPGPCPPANPECEDIVPQSPMPFNNSSIQYIYQSGTSILDAGDMDMPYQNGTYRDYFTDKSIRLISFDYSYDIQNPNLNDDAGVPNSYDPQGHLYNGDYNADTQKTGKLTLESVSFKGKKGVSVIPPMRFDYADDMSDPEQNPPYNSNAYDVWNYYKSDFDPDICEINENAGRLVSRQSKDDVDAWSLKKIRTSLGSEISIEYSSDSYNNPVLHKANIFRVDDIDDYSLSVAEGASHFKAGDRIDLIYASDRGNCEIIEVDDGYGVREKSYTISSVSGGRINVSVPLPGSELDQICGPGNDYDTEKIFAMNLTMTTNSTRWGGGLRVEKITIDGDATSTSTNYAYSQGTTSYEPFGKDVAFYFGPIPQSLEDDFEERLDRKFSELLRINRELIGPGVVYGKVTVTEDVNGIPKPGKVVHNFQVFEEDFVERERIFPNGSKAQEMRIRDFTTRVGNLKSVQVYGSGEELLSESVNQYLYETMEGSDYFKEELLRRYNYQGVIQEAFTECREVKDEGRKIVLSRKEFYPSIVYRTQEIDYEKGLSIELRDLAFDFFSGAVTEYFMKDGYSNQYITKTVPAYRYYAEMGMPVSNPGGNNKNMLTQGAAVYSYKIPDSYDIERFTYETEIQSIANVVLMNANLMSWTDHFTDDDNPAFNNYRPHRNYTFIGIPGSERNDDGSYGNMDSFAELPENVSPSPLSANGWRLDTEYTRYNLQNTQVMEGFNMNKRYGSSRFSEDGLYIIATADNTRYGEFRASGFERVASGTDNVGDIQIVTGSVIQDANLAHTGQQLLEIGGNGGEMLNAEIERDTGSSKTYLASVWQRKHETNETGSFQVSGAGAQVVSFEHIGTAGNWELYQALITVTNTSANFTIVFNVPHLGQSGDRLYLDDFRIGPLDSRMNSYVYNEWGEISHILNSSNLYTEYQYTSDGRLQAIYQERLNHGRTKVSDFEIHYANTN